MADFNVHVATGAIAGGVGVTALMSADRMDPQTGLICFFAAMIGGVLPDVDADESVLLNLIFTFFALLASFFVMFSQLGGHAILESIILWLLAFLFVKLAVFELFTRTTTHRGIFHSLPAGLFFACATAVLMSRLFHQPASAAWLTGLFVLTGCLVHLLMDELYSLNLFGVGGVEHSLGSAFKLYSRELWATAAMIAATVVAFLLAPSPAELVGSLFTLETLEAIRGRLLPAGHWFGLPFLPVAP